MAEFSMGTLYDINKSGYVREPVMTKNQINERLPRLREYMLSHPATYYMLLNREKSDFTLFHLRDKTIGYLHQTIDDIIDCMNNRGDIVDIDLTEDSMAIEVWIKRSGLAWCYYFFPYDEGVIEVQET